MTKEHTSEEIKYRLSDLGVQIGNIAIEYITDLEKENAEIWGNLTKAKELLMKWVELFKPKGGNIPPTPIQVDTEQFLKEIEKC